MVKNVKMEKKYQHSFSSWSSQTCFSIYQWLVTKEDTESYIPGVYETVVRQVQITVLNNR